MDEVKRYVNLAFIFAAMLMAWLFSNIVKLGLGLSHTKDPELLGDLVRISTVSGLVLAVVVAVALWKSAKVYTWALNIAYEMKKVTWPTWDETKYAMKVVIATSCIVALILFCFDLVAKWLTNIILGIN